ncbi:MAG: response regulator [Spirochaetota bacterium]|nr:response regulator [Spirochaetota bacterium]
MKKILVIDDQDSGHLILKDMIENPIGGVNKYLECRMLSAYSGREALNLARSERPDIIIMDINMPDMNGYDTTRYIRKDRELARTYIIAVTAQAMLQDRQKALDAGCDDYISKPYDVSILIDHLVRVLGGFNGCD